MQCRPLHTKPRMDTGERMPYGTKRGQHGNNRNKRWNSARSSCVATKRRNGFVYVLLTENLTVKSLDFSIRLSIFAEESHRYLCFNNKWSLVGSVSVYTCIYVNNKALDNVGFPPSPFINGRSFVCLIFFFTIHNKTIGPRISRALFQRAFTR